MLLVLPIISSRNSLFYPLFLFYSHAITYILFLLYSLNFCVSDNEVHAYAVHLVDKHV